MYWDSEEVSYRDRASHHTRGCCAKVGAGGLKDAVPVLQSW
jgi:hypothetical protein